MNLVSAMLTKLDWAIDSLISENASHTYMLCKAHESHILLMLPLEVIKTESMIVLTWMIHIQTEKKKPTTPGDVFSFPSCICRVAGREQRRIKMKL